MEIDYKASFEKLISLHCVYQMCRNCKLTKECNKLGEVYNTNNCEKIWVKELAILEK